MVGEQRQLCLLALADFLKASGEVGGEDVFMVLVHRVGTLILRFACSTLLFVSPAILALDPQPLHLILTVCVCVCVLSCIYELDCFEQKTKYIMSMPCLLIIRCNKNP